MKLYKSLNSCGYHGLRLDKILINKGIFIDAQSDSSIELSKVLTKEPDFINLLKNVEAKLNKGLSVDGSLRFRDNNFYNAIGMLILNLCIKIKKVILTCL